MRGARLGPGQADELLDQARHHLRAVDPRERAARELDALACLATRRDH
ncbi:hypothetical protein [Actinophytocola xinjiangensis]|nr:hypothetical protein [Actinophytocola xinjiangensis]